MRAYLQRTEVRLSTLYRITVSFASGEGLMILFPLFIKDEITGVLGVFIDYAVRTLPTLAVMRMLAFIGDDRLPTFLLMGIG
jgi:hypothetical protein